MGLEFCSRVYGIAVRLLAISKWAGFEPSVLLHLIWKGQRVGKIGCISVGIGFRGELPWYVVATFGNCCSKVRAV